MKLRYKTYAAVVVASLGIASAVAVPAASAEIPTFSSSLAIDGSSLVAPLAQFRYDTWSALTGAGSAVVGADGSGTGITDVCTGSGTSLSPTKDFGTSDAPLGTNLGGKNTVSTLNPNCPSYVVQIPWAATGTGVVYHIPGVGENLHLNASVIYKIISGQITNWNASAIQSLNTKRVKYKSGTHKVHGKKVAIYKYKTVDSPKLPNLAITLVYRNGSGDTYAFENYLQHASGSGVPSADTANVNFWGGTVYTGSPLNVPATAILDGGGNSGMLSDVQKTPGAFGYIALPVYLAAVQADLVNNVPPPQGIDFSELKNAAGNYEPPNYSNIAAAVDSNTTLPAQGTGFGLSVVDPPAKYKTAYPLATYTYAIVPNNANLESSSRAFEIASFIGFSVSNNWEGEGFGGGNIEQSLDYIALPSAVENADTALLTQIDPNYPNS
jgi:phosphate transport system substrate-binding protein